VNPDQESEAPVWAKDEAFPPAPEGYGWADPKGGTHPCASELELLEIIGNDRAARVVLIWTPHHPRLILPEGWPAAADAVREGRRKRLNDDLAVTADRIRWYGLMLGGVILYMLYRGWQAPLQAMTGERLVFAVKSAATSMSVGLCLMLFLILGFIPWYQARKRQREWRSGGAADKDEWLSVLLFETWLELQKAPVTRLILGLVGIVGLVQLLPSNGIEAAGLMKDAAHKAEWWRVYTSPFLHGNPLHFLMNASALLYLGKRLEVFARWPHLPLVFLLSAAVGNEASMRLLDKPSVGASGGLLGWLGFLLVFESLHRRLVPRSARRRLLAGVFLTAVIGLVGYQFIDNAAHAGGLLAGMIYAVIVFPPSSSAMRPSSNKTDLVAGSLATVLLVLCASVAVWQIVRA
jgi:membrane associated rhomboid family serine protease